MNSLTLSIKSGGAHDKLPQTGLICTFLIWFKVVKALPPLRQLSKLGTNVLIKTAARNFHVATDFGLICTIIMVPSHLDAPSDSAPRPFVKNRIWKFTCAYTPTKNLLRALSVGRVSGPRETWRIITTVIRALSKSNKLPSNLIVGLTCAQYVSALFTDATVYSNTKGNALKSRVSKRTIRNRKSQ